MTEARWAILITTSIGCAAIVANLYSNWATRRQMRQNEQHREDPTIPLMPPPTAFTHFMRAYGFYLLGVFAGLVNVGLQFLLPPPVSLGQVVTIAYSVGCIVFISALQYDLASLKRQDKTIDVIGNVFNIMESHTKRLKKLEDRK